MTHIIACKLYGRQFTFVVDLALFYSMVRFAFSIKKKVNLNHQDRISEREEYRQGYA